MYIRTKDEILKVLNADYMCGVKVYHTEKGMITEKQVLKESDNLAELCDTFVMKFCYKNSVNYNLNYYLDCLLEEHKEDEDVIYGAIWTDKGLIYVAKMNNDGNLELI